jgi:hypothetical protein
LAAALIWYGLALLSLIGAGAIIYWVRRSEEHLTFGVVVLVLTLGFLGLLMFGVGLTS